MDVLIADGVDAITIAHLTEKLSVTKGSFYHHFKDITDFREQMLVLCLEESVTRVIEHVKEGETPLARLLLLEDVAAANDPLEVAFRTWALRDEQAHETLAAIDQQRMDFLHELFTQLGLDDSDAHHAARLFYAVFIGGQHLIPPSNAAQMQQSFAIIRQFYGITSAAKV
jgi:AcrR family transcriptional regulator